MNFFAALLFAWGLERAQLIVCAPNYESLYNGLGAVNLVLRRETKAPMAYRVLVPWLIWFSETVLKTKNEDRAIVYEVIKIGLNACALWAVGEAFGVGAALGTAVLLLLTFYYDYWDWAVEMAGVVLAATGRIELALPGALLLGFSRETAPLAAVAFFLKTFDAPLSFVVLCAAVLPMAGVRLYVGRRALYCDRWQIRYNLDLLKNILKVVPVFYSPTFISVFLSVACVIGAAFRVWNDATWLVPLAAIGAGWTLAKADETRVFSLALPWIVTLFL